MNRELREGRPQSDSAFFGFVSKGRLFHIAIAFLALLFLVAAEIRPVRAASDGTVSLSTQERQWLSQHDGRIRIGITVIPPQILRDKGAFTGLAIDYIRLMEQKLGCRFKLVPYATWNEVIQAAKTRQIDLIFAAQRTPERLTYLLFTEPYIELPNMIVVRKDRQGGASLKEMTGWSVATSEGSAVHEYLQKEHGYLDLRPVQDELSGLMKVSMGEVDAMVVEISRASYYIEKAGILNLRVAGNAGLTYRLRFAVRSDWPILNGILDKGLSAITNEEKRDISRRWIIVGEKSMFASRAFWISFAAGAGGVALAIAGVIVWNRTLRRTVRQRTAELQQELAERSLAEEALAERVKLAELSADIGSSLATQGDIRSALNACADALVRHLDVAFARIWTLDTADDCLELQASAGMYTSIDGSHSRVPFGKFKIGLIAEERRPHVTNAVIGDPLVHDQEWAKREGMVAFAGHPLTIEDKLIGVMAMFSRKPLTDVTLKALASVSNEIAIGIERKLAEEELLKLNEQLEQRVKQRTADLEEKNMELERMNRLFVGRELKMIELKERIRKLEEAGL